MICGDPTFMNPKQSSPITRRTFLRNGAILTASVAALSPAARAQTNQNSKLRIFQMGCGGIGTMQRGELRKYDPAQFVGFADVNSDELNKTAEQYPGSF